MIYEKFPHLSDLYDKRFLDRNIKNYFTHNEINEESLSRFELFLEYKKLHPKVCNSKQYFIFLYGELVWEAKYKEFRSKLTSPYEIKYWLNKGYSESESIVKIAEFKKNKSTCKENFIRKHGEKEGLEKFEKFRKTSSHSLDTFIRKYGEYEGPEKYNEYLKTKDSMSYEYCLKKCNTEKEALELYKKRKQSVISNLETYKNKHGEEKGFELWKDMCKRKTIDFQYALKKCNDNHDEAVIFYADLLKRRRVKLGSASKTSLKFFLPIYEKLKTEYKIFLEIEESTGFFLYDKEYSRSYCYDFCILEQNLIIEFNGSAFHPNTEKYEIDEMTSVLAFYKTKEDIIQKIEYDKRKNKIAEIKGFKVLVVWDDDDYTETKIKIEQFLLTNNINFKYEN